MRFVVFLISLRKFWVETIKNATTSCLHSLSLPQPLPSTASPIGCSQPNIGRYVVRVTDGEFKELTNTQAHRHIHGVPLVVEKVSVRRKLFYLKTLPDT